MILWKQKNVPDYKTLALASINIFQLDFFKKQDTTASFKVFFSRTVLEITADMFELFPAPSAHRF